MRPPFALRLLRARRPRSWCAVVAPRDGARGPRRSPTVASTGDRSATIPARSIRRASATSYGRSVAQQIFDGLVQFDQTLTDQPGAGPVLARLARRAHLDLHLRQGVRFHHGREVTADDVVYSLTRILDPRLRSGAADAIRRDQRRARVPGGRARAAWQASARSTAIPCRSRSPRRSRPSSRVLAVGHAKIVPQDAGRAAGRGLRHAARRHRALPVLALGAGKRDRARRQRGLLRRRAPARPRALSDLPGRTAATRSAGSSSRATSRRARCPRSAGARWATRATFTCSARPSACGFTASTRASSRSTTRGSGWPSRMRWTGSASSRRSSLAGFSPPVASSPRGCPATIRAHRPRRTTWRGRGRCSARRGIPRARGSPASRSGRACGAGGSRASSPRSRRSSHAIGIHAEVQLRDRLAVVLEARWSKVELPDVPLRVARRRARSGQLPVQALPLEEPA